MELEVGEIWEDPEGKHRVGCLDATNAKHIRKLLNGEKSELAIQDPPYNQIDFDQLPVDEYVEWSERWIDNCLEVLTENSSLYIWLGADQRKGFQPLPDFMVMMRGKPVQTRSFITLRNQRGYGTQKNWMAVRQELLYYIKGQPYFEPQYTDIPKKTSGYYKEVNGEITENFERSKSDTIRPGNVWFDIQQVFYRMQENVKPCYAQKPLAAIERIIKASSKPGDLVIDFFSHSGTTLLQSEISDRRCFTMDNDPNFCDISIKRLLHYRETGLTGWQNKNPDEITEIQKKLI